MAGQEKKQVNYQMSQKEVDRLSVMERLQVRLIRQHIAAQELGISVRHVRRLLQQYRKKGPPGLISRRRGKPGNRRLPEALKQEVIALIKSRYYDFGPTFANEKLAELHGVCISTETLRKWMMMSGIWKGKQRRQAKVHQQRPRRSRFGELVQIDGSPHAWFEDRGPICTLIGFIDDAKGEYGYLRFEPAETTEAYMVGLRVYIKKHGRPVSLYSDKHSIFRIHDKKLKESGQLTQFERAAKTLDIECIQANSPQAKGRVERGFETHQDRLVKELRLAGISNIEDANEFLERYYLPKHNNRFARAPLHPDNAHRSVLHSESELDLIFSYQYTRILSKNLSIQFKNTIYQVQTNGIGYALRGARVTVCESFSGKIILLRNGKPLPYSTLQLAPPPSPFEDSKSINNRVDQILKKKKANWKPPPDHPWRRFTIQNS